MQPHYEERGSVLLQSAPVSQVHAERGAGNDARMPPLSASLPSTESKRRMTGRQLLWTLLLAGGLAAFLTVLIGGYVFNWKWTGFADTTLWNWWQLLIWPVTIAIVGLVFNSKQSETSLTVSEREHQTDLRIAEVRQQEEALQTYLDHLAELLLEKQLRNSLPGSDVQEVARAHTLTALRRVGRDRKGLLLQFLHESHLIEGEQPIVDLRGADLSYANVQGADLREADLSGVNLVGANLAGANLSGARLSGAVVAAEQLAAARSLHGAILPDGSMRR